jgi:5-methylcytosine-specific restriction endonuclease McrA
MNNSPYYHGKECKLGHGTLRAKANKICVQCLRDRRKARDKKKYAADPEVIRAKNREYYRNNKQKRRESIKKWQSENPEKYKLMMQGVCARRDARRKGAEGKFTAEELGTLHRKYTGCPYCGSNDSPTIDHIIPLSRGGTNWISNIQLCCTTCNTSKGNKTHEEYIQYKLAEAV